MDNFEQKMAEILAANTNKTEILSNIISNSIKDSNSQKALRVFNHAKNNNITLTKECLCHIFFYFIKENNLELSENATNLNNIFDKTTLSLTTSFFAQNNNFDIVDLIPLYIEEITQNFPNIAENYNNTHSKGLSIAIDEAIKNEDFEAIKNIIQYAESKDIILDRDYLSQAIFDAAKKDEFESVANMINYAKNKDIELHKNYLINVTYLATKQGNFDVIDSVLEYTKEQENYKDVIPKGLTDKLSTVVRRNGYEVFKNIVSYIIQKNINLDDKKWVNIINIATQNNDFGMIDSISEHIGAKENFNDIFSNGIIYATTCIIKKGDFESVDKIFNNVKNEDLRNKIILKSLTESLIDSISSIDSNISKLSNEILDYSERKGFGNITFNTIEKVRANPHYFEDETLAKLKDFQNSRIEEQQRSFHELGLETSSPISSILSNDKQTKTEVNLSQEQQTEHTQKLIKKEKKEKILSLWLS